ncbi:MAG: YbeD family protein [Gammaproteobacteria bacterium]
MREAAELQFPQQFPVKILGADHAEFHAALAAIFAAHVAPIETLTVARKPSSGGRYISVTVTFTATSRAQLDRLYGALSASPQVLMAL